LSLALAVPARPSSIMIATNSFFTLHLSIAAALYLRLA
jgi:hypothetical protein